MANNEDFPQAGLIVAGDDEPSDTLSEFTYPILDDIFYNIIHDICLRTHRDEKIARASSAAIAVELKAAETDPNEHDDEDEEDHREQQPHSVETDGAKYVNGEVFLRGNPLQTTKEIRCPKCKLPRLLHPTDGNGARKPDPNIQYCKKPFFIEKEHFDIYGQVFQQEGPGRGKKKKDMINPLKQTKEGTPTGSQDSTPPPTAEELKPIAFPSAKCINCGQHIPIRRMNNHMVKCIGGGGRDSSRSALIKIQNGNGGGSQNGTPPPGSRNGTPVPGANGKRSSPNKRSPADDFDSDGNTPPLKKKKVIKTIKKTAATKLKAPKMMKSASQHSASNLSFESKAPASDDEDPPSNDDDNDGEYGTVVVEPKKKQLGISKKLKEATIKKRWKIKDAKPKPASPVVEIPGLMAKKVESLVKVAEVKAERGESSESSQTLSSPN